MVTRQEAAVPRSIRVGCHAGGSIMKLLTLSALAPVALLAACATTQAATAEERAYCEQMAERMGVATTHDHAQMKGNPPNTMNVSHERCQQVMRSPVEDSDR
jgi:hypothetical protein